MSVVLAVTGAIVLMAGISIALVGETRGSSGGSRLLVSMGLLLVGCGLGVGAAFFVVTATGLRQRTRRPQEPGSQPAQRDDWPDPAGEDLAAGYPEQAPAQPQWPEPPPDPRDAVAEQPLLSDADEDEDYVDQTSAEDWLRPLRGAGLGPVSSPARQIAADRQSAAHPPPAGNAAPAPRAAPVLPSVQASAPDPALPDVPTPPATPASPATTFPAMPTPPSLTASPANAAFPEMPTPPSLPVAPANAASRGMPTSPPLPASPAYPASPGMPTSPSLPVSPGLPDPSAPVPPDVATPPSLPALLAGLRESLAADLSQAADPPVPARPRESFAVGLSAAADPPAAAGAHGPADWPEDDRQPGDHLAAAAQHFTPDRPGAGQRRPPAQHPAPAAAAYEPDLGYSDEGWQLEGAEWPSQATTGEHAQPPQEIHHPVRPMGARTSGRHSGSDTGQFPAYGSGAGHDTGQQSAYDTGQQPAYDTGQFPAYLPAPNAEPSTG